MVMAEILEPVYAILTGNLPCNGVCQACVAMAPGLTPSTVVAADVAAVMEPEWVIQRELRVMVEIEIEIEIERAVNP